MKRLVAVTVMLVLAGRSAPALAQDTPLSHILIDGEEWLPAGWIPALRPDLPRLAAACRDRAAVVTREGLRYAISADGKELVMTPPGGPPKPIALPHIMKLSGLVLWPAGGTLVVGDAGSKYLWAFRIGPDGGLDGDRYYQLRVRPGTTSSGVTSLAIDTAGRVYAATPLGVQFFDPTGRLSGVLLSPGREPPTGIGFSPAEPDRLIGLFGDKLFARKLRTTGVPVVEK